MFVRVNQRTINGGQPKEIYFFLETRHASIAAIHDTLIAEGRLYGIRYDTRPAGPNRREVTGSGPVSILADSATSILAMTDDLIAADGTVLFSAEGAE